MRNPSSFSPLSSPHYPVIPRHLPSHIRALAILVPRRTYATDTTTHGSGGGAFPPPGFNVNEAKKAPSPPKQIIQSSTNGADQQPNEERAVSKTEPTAVDKTKALEGMTLSELAEAKESAKPDEKAAVKKEEDKRLTLGQKIKKEIQHYWDGTKLLATEVKISSKLALKMAAGYELSRRENRQVSISYLTAIPLRSQPNKT
jgi:LETM1 and EF-hand domain-containing protein 1, mitochondrial